MNEMTGRAIAVVGLVLTVVAIFIDAVAGSSYWDDGTQGVFLLVVAVLAGLLLAASWVQNRPQPARIAAGLSFLLLGYYLWLIAVLAFDNWDLLDAGAWLALAGAAVAVVGSLIGSQSLGAQTVKPSAMGPRGVQMGTLAALGGVVLCVISIWLDAFDGGSYWDASDDHMLGIVMLIVGIACGLAALATWMGRGQAAALWASLVAFMLLGLYAFTPVVSAFGDFGSIDVGGWLGFIGALAAVGGAQLAHMSTATEVRTAAPAPAAPPPPPPPPPPEPSSS